MALLQSKTQSIYEKLPLNSRTLKKKSDIITVDFEQAHLLINFLKNFLIFKLFLNSFAKTLSDSTIHLCFFHFFQALLRRASKIGLRKKESLEDCKNMLMNIKALAFTPLDEVNRRLEIIKVLFLNKDH